MIDDRLSRRAFVRSATAGVTALGLLGPRAMWAAPAPTSPVVLARCETYDLGDLVKCLALAMDQLGGLDSLVAGKTVGVKVNVAGGSRESFRGLSAGRTYQVHPSLVYALASVLDRAGAKRIRILESTKFTSTLERTLTTAGWDIDALPTLETSVAFDDPVYLARMKHCSGVRVPCARW